MEAKLRKPFEGVANVIRFNWHFYVIAVVVAAVFIILIQYTTSIIHTLLLLLLTTGGCSVLLSLVVTWFVYDCSSLYTLHWLNRISVANTSLLININAGFDETSHLLKEKFPHAKICAFDFYNPEKHTEVSIARAQKRYPLFPGTKQITTEEIPLPDHSAEAVFAILSAHEIRNRKERVQFFAELKRVKKEEGLIVVVEHLRDVPNLLAYSLGFLHFHSLREWKITFQEANLNISQQTKITPFLHVFYLR